MSNKKILMRFLGIVIGLAFLAASTWFLFNPVYSGFQYILNQITGIVLGVLFIFYGTTGYSSVFKYFKHRKSK
jgi:uncharacterized protein YacL